MTTGGAESQQGRGWLFVPLSTQLNQCSKDEERSKLPSVRGCPPAQRAKNVEFVQAILSRSHGQSTWPPETGPMCLAAWQGHSSGSDRPQDERLQACLRADAETRAPKPTPRASWEAEIVSPHICSLKHLLASCAPCSLDPQAFL